MMPTTVTSLRDLVDRLGGIATVARMLEIGQPAVYNALAKRRMPATWHHRIERELRRRRIKVDEALFRQDDLLKQEE